MTNQISKSSFTRQSKPGCRISIRSIIFCLVIVYNLFDAFDPVIDQFQVHLASRLGLARTPFESSKTMLDALNEGIDATLLRRNQLDIHPAQTMNDTKHRQLDNNEIVKCQGSAELRNERRAQVTTGSPKKRRFASILMASAIRLMGVEAPSSITAGQPIKLRCNYETRGDKLQSLSWYKNGREFFRYQPFERRQPFLVFNLTGINVDMSRSRNNSIYLTNTTSETSGRYKCEVTANTFQEVNYETNINVKTVSSTAIRTASINKMLTLLSIVSTFVSSFYRKR